MELPVARFGHSSTLVSENHVAVVGGHNGVDPVLQIDVLELGDAVTVTATAGPISVGPINHGADATSDGTLLLSGGYTTIDDAEVTRSNPTRNVEMWSFNGATGELTRLCATPLNKARGYHTTSIVGRQAVFIGGRDADGRPIADAEVASLLGAANSCFGQPPTTHAMTDPRAQHAVAKVSSSGELLVVGGIQEDSGANPRSTDSTEVFSPRRDP